MPHSCIHVIIPALVLLPGCLSTVIGKQGAAAQQGLDQARLPQDFHAFVQTFGRGYHHGSQEYEQRQALFQQRLAEVRHLNSRAHRRWTAGINKLSDRTAEELARLRGWKGGAAPAGGSIGTVRRHLRGGSPFLLSLSGRAKPLPQEVSWVHLNATNRLPNQEGCGSCWAFAASTVLDANKEIHKPNLGPVSFSAQELVSCVPNPQSCGGSGGCDGATVELAMDYAMKQGLSSNEAEPYMGVTGSCRRQTNAVLLDEKVSPVAPAVSITMPGSHQAENGMLGTSFGMTGWERLPENNYEALRRALVERGPVAVSAAASSWFSYLGGVFDHCEKDSVIDHAVVLVGYGHDETLDEKYWNIQNSWGQDWGENGHIRLLRQDDDGTEQCGVDRQPEVGTGCKGGPKEVTVCGMCGVLYDSVVPFFGEPDSEHNNHLRSRDAASA